jgi:hypothetical protein
MLNTRSLTKAVHAPGDLYSQAVYFEVTMEQIRGHNRIDLNNTGNLIAFSSLCRRFRGALEAVTNNLLPGS